MPRPSPARGQEGKYIEASGHTTLAGLLRSLRETARLTQEDLAHRSGLSVRTVRNIELGRTRYPYLDTVEMLVRGLAADPSVAARLHRLARPQLAVEGAAAPGEPGPPRQLPVSGRHFVGRVEELRLLDECAAATASPGTPVIAVLTGEAGVGKTGLALRWAHLSYARFPDGQLYADMGAIGPDHDHDESAGCVRLSAATDAVLHGFLRALQVPKHAIPARADERSALFRSLVVDRRMLIMIDGAYCQCQVRPLLPAANRCLVLVTSRRPLNGLVAYEGAYQISLRGLTEPESMHLLRLLIGERVRTAPSAAREVARCCRFLPGALRAMAELAAGYPNWTFGRLLEELTAATDPPLSLVEGPLTDVPDRAANLRVRSAVADRRERPATAVAVRCMDIA
jgi:transcriptional regulator with XRE-family HTH domain